MPGYIHFVVTQYADMRKRYSTPLLFLAAVLFFGGLQAQDFKPLFNGKDLSGWYSFFNARGKNNDPDHVFSVSNGLLHITGQEFGYIVTEKSYTDFHLVVEFKWGEKKYPPRENAVQDQDKETIS